MKQCPQCNTINKNTAKFCVGCGQLLATVPALGRSKQALIIIGLFFGGLVLLGGYLGYTKQLSVAALKAKTEQLDPRHKKQQASSKKSELARLEKENATLKQHQVRHQSATTTETVPNDPKVKAAGALSFSDLQGDWILAKRSNDPGTTLPVGLSFRPHSIEESFKTGPDNTLNIDTIRWSSTDQLYYFSGSVDQFAANLEQTHLAGQKRVLLKHVDQGRTAWYQRN